MNWDLLRDPVEPKFLVLELESMFSAGPTWQLKTVRQINWQALFDYWGPR